LAQIRSNVYSAGGLYPLHSCNPYLVTHCHLSPTGWARHHLTGMKLCQIKGIPENMASQLPSNNVRDVCQDAAMFTAWTGHRLLDIMNIECGREELDKRQGLRETLTFSAETSQAGKPLKVGESLELRENDRNLKAAKADDTAVPEYLWDQALIHDLDPRRVLALWHLHEFALRWCRRHLQKEFLGWFFRQHGLARAPRTRSISNLRGWTGNFRRGINLKSEASKDWESGRDCVSHCSNASWWEWSGGSGPHFWRWNPCYRKVIRDGVPPWYRSTLP
jgi:hypothetical protein